MKLRILLIAVISTALAETKNVERRVRVPQEEIRSRNIDGEKVNWRYLSQQDQPYTDNSQRFQHTNERGVSSHRPRQTQQHAPAQQAQPQQQQQQQQLEQVPQSQYYQPYSALPGHIRQLIEHTYQPQAPYVDPTSFIYGRSYTAPQQQEQQQATNSVSRTAHLQPATKYQSINSRNTQFNPLLEYTDRRVERQDRVQYKQDYEHQQQQQYQQQQQQPYQQQQHSQVGLQTGAMPESPLPILYLDKNMPSELKQLLQYQAQIPYDVTANRIQYTPKNLFIPKPLPDDVKGPYYYRSKIYYMNEDGEETDDKVVNEEQHH